MQIENNDPTQNQIYLWGSAECDQFDARDKEGEEMPECKRPYFIKGLEDVRVIDISCGGMHTLFLSDQGKVYSVGCNDDGVLGRPAENQRVPGLVELPVPVNKICTGDVHSVAANTLQTIVFVWGFYRNQNGAMGEKILKPTRIGESEFQGPISKVLSGNNHTMVLIKGKVFSWGDQDTCVLGRLSNTRNRIANSLKVGQLGVKNVVDLFTTGYNGFIKKEQHCKEENKTEFVYYSWGLNNYGQLGLGDTEKTFTPKKIQEFTGIDIVNIVGGEHHTLALDKDGNVYGFGRNDDGQIGVGEEINEQLKEIALKEKQELNEKKKEDELKKQLKRKSRSKKPDQNQSEQKNQTQPDLTQLQETDQVYGYQFVKKPMKLEEIKNIKQIYATGNYSYAIGNDNKAYSWGLGSSYVLGTREEDSVYQPYEIPTSFFLGKNIVKLSLGGQHVGVILTSGEVKNEEVSEELLKQKLIEEKKSKKSQKNESNVKNEDNEEIKSKASSKKGIKRIPLPDQQEQVIQKTKNLKLD